MAKGLIEQNTLKDIADAIRAKNGETKQYMPSEMSQAITELNVDKQKITLVIGDSWTDPREIGKGYRDGAESWVEKFKSFTQDLVINTAMSGTGFYQKPNVGDMNFDEQYMSIINNDSYDNSLIDTIIIYGGLNDIDNTSYDNIKNGAINLLNHIRQYTPRAKTYIAFYNHPNRLISYDEQYIVNALSNDLVGYNFSFVKAGGWCLGKSGTFASDNYHPNAVGSNQIVKCVMSMLNHDNGFEIPLQAHDCRLAEPADLHITYPTTIVDHNVTYNPYLGIIHGQYYWHDFPKDTSTSPSTSGSPDMGSITFRFNFNFVGGLDGDHYSPSMLGSAIDPKTAVMFQTINFGMGNSGTISDMSIALDYNVYIAKIYYEGISGLINVPLF